MIITFQPSGMKILMNLSLMVMSINTWTDYIPEDQEKSMEDLQGGRILKHILYQKVGNNGCWR
jgi:hypothetical protein